MAGGARNDPNANPNSEANILVTLFVVTVVVGLLWWKGSGYLVTGLFGIAWAELMLAKHLPFVGLSEAGEGALNLVHKALTGRYDTWGVPFAVLVDVKVATGERLGMPIAAIIAGLAVLCYKKMAGNKFTQKMNMATFMRMQAEYWRTLSVSAYFDPDKAPRNLDQSMRPTDWLRENKIAVTRDGGMDEDACRKALEAHLGPHWSGLEPSTPLHVRALMVIFALHFQNLSTEVNGKKMNAALNLREDVAHAYATMPAGAALDRRIDELTKTWAVNKHVMAAIEHITRPDMQTRKGGFAYTNTALMQMLSECRKQRGVLASAEILWIKGVDRTLHYCLNNVGRRAFHVESAGAISHWHAERVSEQALVEPHVEEALIGVKAYLEEHRISDLESFFSSRKETKPEWQT